MTGKTHITAGALTATILTVFLNQPLWIQPLTILFSVLPDTDHKNGMLSHVLPLYLITKHRGILHSFIIPIIISLFALSPALGYLSHLILDMMTTNGIKPLYPPL